MFTSNNQCFVLLMVLLSWFGSITCRESLHQDEVAALGKILETLGAGERFEMNKDCPSERIVNKIGQQKEQETLTIRCKCLSSASCHITDFLPQELADLKYLETIDVTRNYLQGTIPMEWASLQKVTYISLTANRLSGQIPSYLGRFTSLTYLSLEANQFSGTIPPELGDLVNLTDLMLSSNQLEGNLPEELARLKKLTNFRVSDNNLKGTIPSFIQNWTLLQRLELYASGLEGPIHPEIFRLENLTDLRITDVPGTEFQFPNVSKKMKYLVLRNINLLGKIPESLWKSKDLQTLDVTFNKLEGEIPFDANLPNLTFLSGNMLTGKVPENILGQNKIVDLAYNNFSWPSNCQERKNINTYRSSFFDKNLSGFFRASA